MKKTLTLIFLIAFAVPAMSQFKYLKCVRGVVFMEFEITPDEGWNPEDLAKFYFENHPETYDSETEGHFYRQGNASFIVYPRDFNGKSGKNKNSQKIYHNNIVKASFTYTYNNKTIKIRLSNILIFGDNGSIEEISLKKLVLGPDENFSKSKEVIDVLKAFELALWNEINWKN